MAFSPENQLSRTQLRRNATALLSLRSAPDLAILLDCPYSQLEHLAYHPNYSCFTIPKRNGSGFRDIEDPEPDLKVLQKELNLLLQSVYHFHRTDAAFGFLIACRKDTQPRNIRTNAEQHLGHDWMLNADFKDFFHSINDPMVREIWSTDPFRYQDTALVEILTRLCTYTGRLPMGAPTSPILSNLATRELDTTLLSWARRLTRRYTRFADDLTFSGNDPITSHDVQEIRQMCRVQGFVFNESKVQLFSPSITKIVTGLVVDEKVDLPPAFLDEARAAIDNYRILRQAQYWSGDYDSRLVEQARQEIEGCLRFARFILRDDQADYRQLKERYEQADAPVNSHASISWLHFSNYC